MSTPGGKNTTRGIPVDLDYRMYLLLTNVEEYLSYHRRYPNPHKISPEVYRLMKERFGLPLSFDEGR